MATYGVRNNKLVHADIPHETEHVIGRATHYMIFSSRLSVLSVLTLKVQLIPRNNHWFLLEKIHYIEMCGLSVHLQYYLAWP